GYTGSAAALVGLGRTDDAIAILRQGLELLPDNAEILAELEQLGASADGANSDEAGGQSAGQDGANGQAATNGANAPPPEPVNFMPSYIAEFFSQLAVTMPAEDFAATYAIATNPQLVAFAEEAGNVSETRRIRLGSMVITADDRGWHHGNFAPMVSVSYNNFDENGNGTHFSISRIGVSYNDGPFSVSGHFFERYDVEGHVANGRHVSTGIRSDGVSRMEGFLVDGFWDGEFVNLRYADGVATPELFRTYSAGWQISVADPDGTQRVPFNPDIEGFPRRYEFSYFRNIPEWGVAD
ncbi:MAG: tetratricopeptide repeat protein, partial [Defluviitaleaceae bacterium]|nr:tetratricopeptide repeat protein [Defluviitaleaceae bacterium]